jgi:hypothetical protein
LLVLLFVDVICTSPSFVAGEVADAAARLLVIMTPTTTAIVKSKRNANIPPMSPPKTAGSSHTDTSSLCGAELGMTTVAELLPMLVDSTMPSVDDDVVNSEPDSFPFGALPMLNEIDGSTDALVVIAMVADVNTDFVVVVVVVIGIVIGDVVGVVFGTMIERAVAVASAFGVPVPERIGNVITVAVVVEDPRSQVTLAGQRASFAKQPASEPTNTFVSIHSDMTVQLESMLAELPHKHTRSALPVIGVLSGMLSSV